MFTTTPLCAVCNPWVQNATGYASQSVCINSNNDFGMPSRTYDCYCQSIGPCQEKVKTEGYITISALISANFSWFQLISVGIESESAGINQIGSYRLESARVGANKKKKKGESTRWRSIAASSARVRHPFCRVGASENKIWFPWSIKW